MGFLAYLSVHTYTLEEQPHINCLSSHVSSPPFLVPMSFGYALV
jgi:hypothetical protein